MRARCRPLVALLLFMAGVVPVSGWEPGPAAAQEAPFDSRFFQVKPANDEVFALAFEGFQATREYQWTDARGAYEQALQRARELRDHTGEAMALQGLAYIAGQTGEPGKALGHYAALLERLRADGNQALEAIALANMGPLYLDIGEPQKALTYLTRALPGIRQISTKVPGYEAAALNNIGLIYARTGESLKAFEYYRQALEQARIAHNQRGEAATLNNISLLYGTTGEPRKALEYLEQLLPVRRAAGDLRGEATTLGNLGEIHLLLGNSKKALECYEQSLPLLRATGQRQGEASVLNSIGEVYERNGEFDRAMEQQKAALQLARTIGDRYGEAQSLSAIGRLQSRAGNQKGSVESHRQAVALLEGVREELGGNSDGKQAFLRQHLPTYHALVDALLRGDQPEEAFAAAEKAKGRTLLDLLNSGKVDLSSALTPEERRLELEKEGRIAHLTHQLLDAAPTATEAVLKDLRLQQAAAERDIQTFHQTLYARYPDRAHKTAAVTTTLPEVGKWLPPDTALLEYVTLQSRGVDRTILFCVTQEDGKAVLRAYPVDLPEAELGRKAGALRRACADPSRELGDAAREGYRLLVAAAAPQLASKKRLVLCPDGPLWGVPFQALDQNTEPGKPSRFLIENFEIDYAYSATGAETVMRAERRAASKGLLALADPVFSAPQPGAADPGGEGRGGLAPLPGTRAEAEALSATFPGARLLTRADAQETTLKREAGEYRILHFATHGLFNIRSPLLSGIALAEPPRGSEEDGYLTAREIFDLKLNAEMVVLSACDTGRGEKRGGEGLVGLSWALFVAGARSQVVSQWKVADESTAELMKQFYHGLKAGKGRGDALREASLGLLKDGKHAHPFYWAPFILMGDWRPLEPESK